MGIVSYAQNFEDVILWRALKHVDRGFYIDIGAMDPVVASVSQAFYEIGWRGVHVEPTAAYAERLRQARPDEIVIQAAIGTNAKTIPFWEFPGTGDSTGKPAIAASYEQDNRKGVRVEVPCIRLSKLLSDYRDRDIHWLKIDVEGMEGEVIRTWRPAKARPWIVVVESTKPNSPEPSFADWEPFLVKLGYEFAYFDGLNRFYVSAAHPELRKHFGPGPNVFDEFVLSGNANAPFYPRIVANAASLREQAAARADEAARASEALAASDARAKALQAHLFASDARAKTLEADLFASDARAKTLEADLLAKTQALDAIYASTSWRITAPLRSASRTARWFARGSRAWLTLRPGSRPRRVARRLRITLFSADSSREDIQNFVEDNHIEIILANTSPTTTQTTVHNTEALTDLSSSARSVYAELKAAIALHEGSR
jgi:FkbM family methyltransferase